MARGGRGKGGGKSKTVLCASGEDGCVKPDGTVTWVFCEACTQWYHCPCASVDAKKAEDDDFIFICKGCKPQKEKEFSAIKPDVKREIGVIMDRHPVFSTALIARRCFATKSASNEYHFGRPGIPVTLRELEEKLSRDIDTMDHFKHLATVMSERMASAVKPEFVAEAKAVAKEVSKLIKTVGSASSSSSSTNNKNKGGKGNKENAENEKATSSSSSEEEQPAAPTPKGKKASTRGSKATTPAAAKGKVTTKDEDEPMEVDSHKCDMCRNIILLPMYQCLELHLTCHLCFRSAVRGYCPVCQRDTNRNRRAKKHDIWSTVQKKKAVEEEKENGANSSSSMVQQQVQQVDIETTTPNKPVVVNAKPSTKEPAAGGRKRKAKTTLTAVNYGKGAKMQKTVKGSSMASPNKTTIVTANNLVNLSALSQPLPPQVVLPTTPLAAPQVQNLTGIRGGPPPPQLIQLRPTGAPAMIRPNNVQIRAPNAPQLAPGQRPQGAQFFKIVGGKPVQISAANLHRLPAAAITSLQPQGSRVMYMRGPAPPSGLATSTTMAATANAAAPVSPQPAGGNKIILLSNKNQQPQQQQPGGASATSPGSANKGSSQPAPPSIVRIVSPTSSSGGKLTFAPASPNKVTTLRPSGGGTTTTSGGPILLRTVAPRPAGTGAPIRLPIAPLPKSALQSSVLPADKAAQQAQADAAAKAIQVLLPKRPLPPNAQLPTQPTALKPGMLSAVPGMTTTTTTTANGAFVWTNSARANFKLSSRINFAALDKFKNVVNKDVHFILANIVTEDKTNDFSFRLHLKREPPTGKGKKAAAAAAAAGNSYLELEAKAKVPTAQEWSLKVKTEPPVFLVSGGNFLAEYPAVRVPKDIADKPFVDYELHIDKCSTVPPTTTTTTTTSTTKKATAPTVAPKRGGRKVAAK